MAGDEIRRAVALGTFDLLHPGHVHYLEEAAAMADELHVIVARAENVTHKPRPVVPDPQRVAMVGALEPVDRAHRGHPEEYLVPIREIDPAVIVLGYDQHHDADAVADQLADAGIDAEVQRASKRPRERDDELLSTGAIIDRILDERG